MDSDVTEQDLLAAIDRAAALAGVRLRRPGEFDVYQYMQRLGRDTNVSTATGALSRLVRAGRLASEIVFDPAQHKRLRVYWFPPPATE